MAARIDAQRAKVHLAGQRRRTPGVQADLVADEGHGTGGTYRHAKLRPGVRGEPAGDVNGQHRQPAGVDRFDGGTEITSHFTAEPGAKQRIDDHLAGEQHPLAPGFERDAH